MVSLILPEAYRSCKAKSRGVTLRRSNANCTRCLQSGNPQDSLAPGSRPQVGVYQLGVHSQTMLLERGIEFQEPISRLAQWPGFELSCSWPVISMCEAAVLAHATSCLTS